jgi:carbon storage regulator CsrA
MGRLVLTRRPNQAILIDNKTTVTIISCSRGKVRLGIDAPSSVHVVRDDAHKGAPDHEDKSVKQA